METHKNEWKYIKNNSSSKAVRGKYRNLKNKLQLNCRTDESTNWEKQLPSSLSPRAAPWKHPVVEVEAILAQLSPGCQQNIFSLYRTLTFVFNSLNRWSDTCRIQNVKSVVMSPMKATNWTCCCDNKLLYSTSVAEVVLEIPTLVLQSVRWPLTFGLFYLFTDFWQSP